MGLKQYLTGPCKNRDLLTTLATEHDGPIYLQGYREAQAGGAGYGQLTRAGKDKNTS